MAILNDIASAVAGELAAHGFSLPFAIRRAYLPVYDLKDMADLHITVVPKGITVEPAGRNVSQYDYSVDVGVQKRLSSTESSEIDPLTALSEEIADFFRLRRLAACPEAIWVKTEHKYLFAPEHLDPLRQFTGVITLTFRVIR